MGKIEKEVLKVTGLTPERKESRQDFILRVMMAVGKLPDADWENLSEEAQDWFNGAADIQIEDAKKKTKRELPDFPDADDAADAEDEPEEKAVARRGTKVEKPVPKIGIVAKVTTKRGKSATGKIIEIDDEIIALKLGDGSIEEFSRDRVDKIEVAGGKTEDAGEEDPIKVGAMVMVTTKRGKEVTGKIVEIDDDVIVLDVDGETDEFSRDRVDTIKPVGKTKAKAEDEDTPKAGRRGSKEPEPEDTKTNKRSTNEGGVSIGTRIKEIIADDLEATEADIAKVLKKEGIEFKENTLKLNFTEAHKFLAILKKAKRLK